MPDRDELVSALWDAVRPKCLSCLKALSACRCDRACRLCGGRTNHTTAQHREAEAGMDGREP